MANKIVNHPVYLFLAVVGSVFFLQKAVPQPDATSLSEQYRSAIKDAAIVDPRENVDNLLQISPDNPLLQPYWNEDKTKILVVTWKSQQSYEKYLKTANNTSQDQSRLIWVTVSPQVKEFCKQYLKDNPNATAADLKLRLQQYLGLDPNWNYDVFVEMWVDPRDLFRPCVDPEVTDKQCNLDFQKDAKPKVIGATQGAAIENYQPFYENLYYRSIRSGMQPFTGLGYTYDWGNPKSRVGASEFILVPGAAYKVKEAVPTLNYCKP